MKQKNKKKCDTHSSVMILSANVPNLKVPALKLWVGHPFKNTMVVVILSFFKLLLHRYYTFDA